MRLQRATELRTKHRDVAGPNVNIDGDLDDDVDDDQELERPRRRGSWKRPGPRCPHGFALALGVCVVALCPGSRKSGERSRLRELATELRAAQGERRRGELSAANLRGVAADVLRELRNFDPSSGEEDERVLMLKLVERARALSES